MYQIEKITLAGTCTHCGEHLPPPAKRTTVYLERSSIDGRWYLRGELPPTHESDGIYPFAKACASSSTFSVRSAFTLCRYRLCSPTVTASSRGFRCPALKNRGGRSTTTSSSILRRLRSRNRSDFVSSAMRGSSGTSFSEPILRRASRLC